MNTWFTSDQHFGHAKIIEYCKRPFKNVSDMDASLIRNHNSKVMPGDNVYHLGDFAFHNHKKYLSQLNGNHFLVKGNHEGKDWRDAGFGWVKDIATVRVGEQDFFLSHYAHRIWNRAHYGVIHLYGHSHGTMPDLGKSADAGVDAWSYFPVSAEQIMVRFKDVENLKHH